MAVVALLNLLGWGVLLLAVAPQRLTVTVLSVIAALGIGAMVLLRLLAEHVDQAGGFLGRATGWT